nr:peptidase G2 autoproteolytic cleavage domain-containing protein [Bacillus cereus]
MGITGPTGVTGPIGITGPTGVTGPTGPPAPPLICDVTGSIGECSFEGSPIENGGCSFAEGCGTIANGDCSHAEGCGTEANGDCSHSEGCCSIANGDCSHAEGEGNTASGRASHVEGGAVDPLGNPAPNLASGSSAHAEGVGTIASGFASHAEGGVLDITFYPPTQALGDFSHAEGFGTNAGEEASHAEGVGTTANGVGSHAEGRSTTASGDNSHAEGEATSASGQNSHAEGFVTIASGFASHAEGSGAYAIGDQSHAEGRNTTAMGENSHAEGFGTTASGDNSHAEGQGTTTAGFDNAHIMGRFGDATEANSWFIGNGTTNILRGLGAKWLASDGEMYIDGTTYNTGGADFAEMFETIDGTSIDVGYFVTLEEDKIRIATSSDDFILGISSATPSLLGNSAGLSWHGRYVLDAWGRRTYHEVTIPSKKDRKGNEFIPEHSEIQPVINPEWDPKREYIPRKKRAEWVPVGLIGKILVRDDGTCQVNGYCSPNNSGIATAADSGYRVMKRTGPNQICVLFR